MARIDELKNRVERQARRIQKARDNRPSLFGQTAYIGTLGLLFVIPVVGGAYLGQWLDRTLTGHSIHWTVNLILLGVIIGGINVYLFLRD